MNYWILLLVFVCTYPFKGMAQSKSTYNTMYLCMDCKDPTKKNSADSFYESYEQLGVNKKGILGVGSVRMSIDTNPHDEEGKKKLEFFQKNKIPYHSKSGNQYEVLQSHLKGGGSQKENIKKNLLTYFRQLDKSKPIVIHLAGHGYNGGMSGVGTDPPEKAGLAMYEAGSLDRPKDVILTHEELSQIMKEAGLLGASAPPVRIVAQHCYGGGVHWLSEKFPNVCSASFTDYKNPHMVYEQLPKKFWGNYNQMIGVGKKPSLSDTFMSVYGEKGRNQGASLGSTAYARQILEKKGLKYKISDGYEDWDELLKDVNYDNLQCPTVTTPALENQKNLENLITDVSHLFSSEENPYVEGLEDLKMKESYYQKLIAEYKKNLKAVKAHWNSLDEAQKLNKQREWSSSADDFGAWVTGSLEDEMKARHSALESKKNKVEMEFEAYRKKNLPKIMKYLAEKDKARILEEVNLFHEQYKSGKVSKEEMETYKRMLKCEAMPL